MALGKSDSRERYVSKFEALRCKFEHFGVQCKLMGDISPGNGDGAKFYCPWHLKIITTSPDLNTFHEFGEWLEEYIDQYPLEKYGIPQYSKKGEFLGYKGDQFHKYSKSQLWELMGNRT